MQRMQRILAPARQCIVVYDRADSRLGARWGAEGGGAGVGKDICRQFCQLYDELLREEMERGEGGISIEGRGLQATRKERQHVHHL